MTVQKVKLESLNIKEVGYDIENQILEIKFVKSGVVCWKEVPQHTYQAFVTAPSADDFFLTKIKGQFERQSN